MQLPLGKTWSPVTTSKPLPTRWPASYTSRFLHGVAYRWDIQISWVQALSSPNLLTPLQGLHHISFFWFLSSKTISAPARRPRFQMHPSALIDVWLTLDQATDFQHHLHDIIAVYYKAFDDSYAVPALITSMCLSLSKHYLDHHTFRFLFASWKKLSKACSTNWLFVWISKQTSLPSCSKIHFNPTHTTKIRPRPYKPHLHIQTGW